MNAPALAAPVNEPAPARAAMRGDASGDGNFAAFEAIVARLGAGLAGREFVFEWVNALRAQDGELGFALFDQ